jgi:hypothetical protein
MWLGKQLEDAQVHDGWTMRGGKGGGRNNNKRIVKISEYISDTGSNNMGADHEWEAGNKAEKAFCIFNRRFVSGATAQRRPGPPRARGF